MGKMVKGYTTWDDWLLFRRNASRLVLYISLIDGAHLLPWRRFPIIARGWRSPRHSTCTDLHRKYTHLALKAASRAKSAPGEIYISRYTRRYILYYVLHTNYQEWKFRLCSSSASPSIIQRCVLICYSKSFFFFFTRLLFAGSPTVSVLFYFCYVTFTLYLNKR